MEEILTSDQVAQILQVHPFTVLKFIKQGKLKASKIGRVYRIRRSDVDKFLDSHLEQPSGHAKPTTTSSKKHTQDNSSQHKAQQNSSKEPQNHPPKKGKDHYVIELKS